MISSPKTKKGPKTPFLASWGLCTFSCFCQENSILLMVTRASCITFMAQVGPQTSCSRRPPLRPLTTRIQPEGRGSPSARSASFWHSEASQMTLVVLAILIISTFHALPEFFVREAVNYIQVSESHWSDVISNLNPVNVCGALDEGERSVTQADPPLPQWRTRLTCRVFRVFE